MKGFVFIIGKLVWLYCSDKIVKPTWQQILILIFKKKTVIYFFAISPTPTHTCGKVWRRKNSLHLAILTFSWNSEFTSRKCFFFIIIFLFWVYIFLFTPYDKKGHCNSELYLTFARKMFVKLYNKNYAFFLICDGNKFLYSSRVHKKLRGHFLFCKTLGAL